jgi:signal transduction histidine kinase
MKPRTLSRLAWSIGTFSIALMISALVLMFVDRHVTLPAGAPDAGWNFSNVLNGAVNIAVPAIGLLLASRRPEHPIGWMFLAAGFTLGIGAFGLAYGVAALVAHPGSLPAGLALAWLGNWVSFIPLGVLAFLFLLFPTGHLRTPRWRPVARFMAGAFALLTAFILIYATAAWRHPFKQFSGGGPSGFLFVVLLAGALGASLVAIVVRFRGSVGDERLQLKWFATSAVLVVATFFASFFSNSSSTPPLLSVLQSLAFVLLWTAIGIAVLKYRLYEIDVVISRAVVYGSLAVFITLVYAGLVIGVGSLVGNRRNPLLSAIAAALVAVAFQPVRQRAGRLANRVVYGKRATPYEVLSDFAGRIAGTYSSEDVLPRMAQIVAAGTGAERVVVWLRVGNEFRAEAASDGSPEVAVLPVEGGASPSLPPGEVGVPVTQNGELLGTISIRMPRGEVLTSAGERLVSDVASQAGLVLRNVRLIEELRASRQRIVAAQDQERRKLERNIHDGAQQQLVALAVKANLAQSLARKDPERAEEMLSQLKVDAQDALENLRDLARGIYPPLLADQGLVAALIAQARKSPVPVTVEADGIGRFPQDAEAAVYFCTLEALQNVAKYAQASGATIHLSRTDGQLEFEVADDGVGFDQTARGYGTGTQGMADRLAALGGRLVVTSSPGAGTKVRGRVPATTSDPGHAPAHPARAG